MDNNEFLWEKLKHENELFSSRANCFLVTQTLFIVSMAALKCDNEMKIIVPILGVLISLIWYVCSKRNLDVQKEIKAALEEPIKITKCNPRWLGTHILYGKITPFIFVLAWLCIFLTMLL